MARTRPQPDRPSARARREPAPARPDPAPAALLDRLKAYVRFSEEDTARLRKFFPFVRPHLDTIVEDFYDRIAGDPRALGTITGGEEQIARLKGVLRSWLERSLQGPHDEEFALAQAQIGRRHVKVGLEQSYMIAGVYVFREHLNRILAENFPQGSPDSVATQRAFVRLLDMVLALMLETYRDDYMRKILQTEQNATMRRLAALGEVAASIAHEVRNPLAGISGAIQVLGQDMRPDDDRREIIAEVLREIRRLDERVNDLLLYSRPANLSRHPVRPVELLQSTVRVLGEDPILRKVRIHVRAPKSLPLFPLDPGQVQQVLVNLVLNAVQAMDGAGEIVLEARLAEGGAGMEFAVEDDGPGVRPEIVDEIFRPFFTTRRLGTGLGLPISRKIVESHGGTLGVEEGRARGARFAFTIPWPPDEPAPHPPLR